ncbi:MAG: pre-peptidase C-terminal domain-containing protein, partial [Thermoplasmata archaeon]
GNTNEPVELTSGVAKTGSLDATNTKAYYKITVSTGTALRVVLDGPNGADFDLYVKKGALPTTSSYDARGYTNSADEQVSITNPAGTYYIMVNRYSGSGSYTITATVETGNSGGNGGGNGGNTNEPVELTSGVAKTGSLDATNTKAYYKITVSTGTALKVVLDGPNGADFDLYVKKGALPTTSSYDARGYTNSADEQVSISNPAGTYYIMVNRYSGSGSYTITATVESGSGGNNGNVAKWTYIGIAGYDADDITTMVNSTVNWFKNIGSSSKVNILLLTDEYGHGNSHAYYITPNGQAQEIPLNQINSAWTNEVNTGDKSVLVSFFRYAVTNYPAEHYYLHTDSHSRCGLSILYDETSYDRMDFTEIKSALAELYNIIHKKIDIFWYGGCWQMNIASAYQIYNYVEYMGASEHTDSHPMRAPISKLKSNPEMATRDVLIEAVNLVASAGGAPYAYGGVELAKVPMLAEKVNALSQKLIAKMGTYKAKIIEARNQTQEFEEHYGAPYADLYHFALKLKANVDDAEIQGLCSEVMNAVNQTVVVKKWASGWGENLQNAYGIGIMFPKDWYTYQANQTYFTISDFAKNTQWDEFYAKLNGFASGPEFLAEANEH